MSISRFLFNAATHTKKWKHNLMEKCKNGRVTKAPGIKTTIALQAKMGCLKKTILGYTQKLTRPSWGTAFRTHPGLY